MLVSLVMQNNKDDMEETLMAFLDTGFFRWGRYSWDREIAFENYESETVGVLELDVSYFEWILFRIWFFVNCPNVKLVKMDRCNDAYILALNA